VATGTDPSPVSGNEGEYLRRFLVARAAGNADEMAVWWEALLTENVDRVRGMVAIEARGRLSSDEQQEAVQRALIKLARNMVQTFRGSSMGELVGAMRTLVKGVCIDVQREAARVSRRETPLEAGWDDEDDGGGRHAAAIAGAAQDAQGIAEAQEDDEEVLRLGRDFLDWATPQLSPRLRSVIELDRGGVPVEEMMRRMGVSRDVIYAARSRALRELGKLMEAYPS